MSASPPENRRSIIRDSLGVGLATGLYGTSFGAVSVGAGLSVAQTSALSLLVFTGASQFALISVLASGGTAFAAAATAMLLGTRNALYGLRVAPLLALGRSARLSAAHLLIDESTAMTINRTSRQDARLGFLATGGAVFVLWNLFTLLGALAGTALGDPRTFGLDAAVGGAFLALLWPQLRDPGFRLVAVLAVAVALGAIPIAPAGVPVLAAFAVALLAGLLSRSQR